MKSSKQQKRKVSEVSGKQDDCLVVSVKKAANGAGLQHPKATECLKMSQLEPRNQLHIPRAKIKLQLFPINEDTRLGLEKDGRNPFLELTLSERKKISSVVRHLNTKWGNSSVASGQLMLFPYDTKLEQLASCRRWTLNDNAITAGDVFVAMGSPSLFRMRYGWCFNLQQEKFGINPNSRPLETGIESQGKSINFSEVVETKTHHEKKLDETVEGIQKQVDVKEALLSDVNGLKGLDIPTDHMDGQVTTNVPVQSTLPWDDLTNMSIGGLLSEASLLQKISNNNTESVDKSPFQPLLLTSSDISIGGLLSEASLLSNKRKSDTQTVEGGHAQMLSPSNDSFISLSIGGFFNESSFQARAGCIAELKEKKSSLLPNAPLGSSLDAFITAELNAHSQVLKARCYEPNLSLLDAEETCHAFPTRGLQRSIRDGQSSGGRASSNR